MYGMPIGMERWSSLFSEPRHVGEDFPVLNGRKFHVSTVWLGLDHSFSRYPSRPIIFETMIFPGGVFDELYQDRYSTLTEARAGHWRALRWLYREQGVKPPILIHKGRKP
jgi:hypothetical protein